LLSHQTVKFLARQTHPLGELIEHLMPQRTFRDFC
jgi:hypothetical protein